MSPTVLSLKPHMPTSPQSTSLYRLLVPDISLLVLMAIGVVDLITTAMWHAKGQIVELNPLLRPIIESSEWSFVVVKGATLVLGYLGMVVYGRTHHEFVRAASRMGVILYIGIYLIWFLGGL